MKMNVIMSLLEELALTGVEFEDIEVSGDSSIEVDGMSFMILDETEKAERLEDYIRESASYFNHSFLAGETGLPEKVFDALLDENEAVCDVIEATCGMESFIEAAVSADGAGHFLNRYDGIEYELDDHYFAYRID